MTTHLLLAASDVGAYTLTFDRVAATAASLVALLGVVAGALAVVRRTGPLAQRGPLAALAAGITGVLVGALLLATTDGGPGTGNGVVGAGAAVVLGLVAIVLGGLARARTRAASR